MILSETSKSSDLTAEPGQTEEQPVEEKEPPKKKRVLKNVAAVIARKKDILTASATDSTSKLEEVIQRCKAEQHELDDLIDPLEFWYLWKNSFLCFP